MMSGILSQVLLTAMFEFMSAQSPYHTRGLLVSFIVPLTVTSYIVGASVGLAPETQCLFYTCTVLSHLVLSENSNMFYWISPVLCCGSLVQDKSER